MSQNTATAIIAIAPNIQHPALSPALAITIPHKYTNFYTIEDPQIYVSRSVIAREYYLQPLNLKFNLKAGMPKILNFEFFGVMELEQQAFDLLVRQLERSVRQQTPSNYQLRVAGLAAIDCKSR